jgi:ABC-2 type transport system ATP-binding protein
MIRFENVTKGYGDLIAVDKVKLEIPESTFFCLLGPNGAGKTTLIKMLTGLINADEGEIYVNDKLVNRDANSIKRMIGVVPQHINLDKELSVEENLYFSGMLYKLPKKQIAERVEELLDMMELKSARKRLCKRLSGGMKRKLMIAKALIHDPDIIILDEPTVGIDTTARRKIWTILKRMKLEGKTLLMTTHYIEEAEYLCDLVTLMHEGKIFRYETPEKLILELGVHTVEYFVDEEAKYEYFPQLNDAKDYAHKLDCQFTIRKTTLDDVFYQFTDRMVE